MNLKFVQVQYCGRESPNFQGFFTTKVIKSHVKLHVKFNAARIPRESTPYTFHSTIENFSACCNTSHGIKLAASQADRLRSACSLAIKNKLKNSAAFETHPPHLHWILNNLLPFSKHRPPFVQSLLTPRKKLNRCSAFNLGEST